MVSAVTIGVILGLRPYRPSWSTKLAGFPVAVCTAKLAVACASQRGSAFDLSPMT
jgi:hypothetical protein